MTVGSLAPKRRSGTIRCSSVVMTVAALTALLLVVWAAPAVGKAGGSVVKFTTGTFAVNCTSTGELCSPAEKLSFKLRHRGVLTKIVYTTGASHCSAIKLHVYRRGHQIAQTGVLAAANVTERVKTHIRLRRGPTTLAFKAQGFIGGCNVGTTFSWGGKVTVTVTFPAHH